MRGISRRVLTSIMCTTSTRYWLNNILSFFVAFHIGQTAADVGTPKKIGWCTITEKEQMRCEELSKATADNIAFFGDDYHNIICHRGINKEDCMTLIDKEISDVVSVDPGLVFIAGRYHSLIPVMQEVRRNGQKDHFSVAVIKRGSLENVHTLSDLKGKKACFPAVGTLAGWFIPISTLVKSGGMEIHDCNNHIKTVAKFFGPSCAVNSLIDKYNRIGDNSNKLCALCGGNLFGEKCTVKDPYHGYEGAIKCLIERGDIAFVKHSTMEDMPDVFNSESYQLLCRDGSRSSPAEYGKCNWGRVPNEAIITTTAKSPAEKESYQRFLRKLVEAFGARLQNVPFGNGLYSAEKSDFQLFRRANESGPENLLLQDSTETLESIPGSKQLYSTYLQENLPHILDVHHCPIATMTLCVTSDVEQEKCIRMKFALKAQLLKPQIDCFRTDSQIKCMEAVKNRFADVAVFDASDIYDAGKFHGLKPFMSEIYDTGKPEYYVVAVAKEEDPSTDLTYLKNKNTCHAGINIAASWTIPLSVLISNGWIRNYGCDPVRTASEYFSKSCVPGSLSYEYVTDRTHLNLCDLCHSATYRLCRRNPSEDYFGHTGAFRCLVEGGGDVAFVKHTTVFENTDGKKRDIWARNTFSGDFELLCLDGRRADVKDYKKCSLGKVKANAIVTRGGPHHNETEVNTFINLFSYAQQFYSRKDNDYFSFCLFKSPPPYSDVIFQDATTRLQVIPKEKRTYEAYLGRDFIRAKKIVDCH